MADLTYLPVAFRLGITVGDTSSDADGHPDTICCDEGRVVLRPRIPKAVVKVSGISALLGQAELTGQVRSDGWIVWDHARSVEVEGVPCIEVVDLTSEALQPHIEAGATHTYRIEGARAKGIPVDFGNGEVPVRLSPAEVDPELGVINLADQLVAGPPAVVQVVRGPKGVGVEDVDQDAAADGDLVLNLTDGSTTTPVPLPPGVIPDDAQLATALGQPQAKGALSAQIVHLAAAVVDLSGNPLGSGHVVIKVDTANGNEITDIVWQGV
jgi:hypothetical protein